MLAGMASTAGAAWKQSGGRWWYEKKDGSYIRNDWLKDGGKKYYFDNAGWMVTGWRQIGKKWYYFDTNGTMKTGWLNDGGKWYYLTKNGVMQTGWVRSGSKRYYMGAGGAMATGWQRVGASWYYFNKKNGEMLHDTVIDGYILSTSGKMLNTILCADRKSVKMAAGDSVEIVFTFARTGSVTYNYSGSAGLEISWGSWYNSNQNIKLKITGLSRGKSTIVVSNSVNDDTVTIPVTIR